MSYGSVWSVGLAVALLTLAAIAVLTVARVPQRVDALVAVGRAAIQLTVVALVIGWIFANPAGAPLYLSVMLVAATATSVRRIGCGREHAPRVFVSIAAGAALTTVFVVSTQALPWSAQTLLPFVAQMIGGTMTAVSLGGTRLRDDAVDQWATVEGWLVLGARPGQAVADLARRSAQRALIPPLDQTRSAGLVTLPGAFVGMLLGGASPAQAAQVQLLVLAGLLAAQSLGVVLVVWLLAPAVGCRIPTWKAV